MFFTHTHTHTRARAPTHTKPVFIPLQVEHIMYVTLTLVDIHFRLFLRVHIISTAEGDQGGWHSVNPWTCIWEASDLHLNWDTC
jgi:hypothetical protein